MLAFLRHNPRAMVLSVLLHLGLLFLLLWAREQQISYMDSAAPIQSPQPDESIPVIVQDNRVAERLEEKRFDIIISDVRMPGIDGLEILDRIKKIDSTLDLLDNHEYGYCESCGVEIGIRRLEARPTASLCIDCKTLEEIKEKQMA